MLIVDVEENYNCSEYRIDWNKFGEKGLKSMSAFAIADKLFVFVTSTEMLIYGTESIGQIPISNPPLRQILAVSQSSQPYPGGSEKAATRDSRFILQIAPVSHFHPPPRSSSTSPTRARRARCSRWSRPE